MSQLSPDDSSIREITVKDDILLYCEFLDQSKIKIDICSNRELLFAIMQYWLPMVIGFAWFFDFLSIEWLVLVPLTFICGFIGSWLIDDHFLIDTTQKLICKIKKLKYPKKLSRKIIIHFDEIKYVALDGRIHQERNQLRGYDETVHRCGICVVSQKNEIFHITSQGLEPSTWDSNTQTWKEKNGCSLESLEYFAKFIAELTDAELLQYPKSGGALYIGDGKPQYYNLSP